MQTPQAHPSQRPQAKPQAQSQRSGRRPNNCHSASHTLDVDSLRGFFFCGHYGLVRKAHRLYARFGDVSIAYRLGFSSRTWVHTPSTICSRLLLENLASFKAFWTSTCCTVGAVSKWSTLASVGMAQLAKRAAKENAKSRNSRRGRGPPQEPDMPGRFGV